MLRIIARGLARKIEGHVFHAKELKLEQDDLETTKEILVVGENKSSWNVCFTAATTGAKVHMVIRPSGGGPSWMRPEFISTLKVSIYCLGSTRLFTRFDPRVWASWIRYILRLTCFP